MIRGNTAGGNGGGVYAEEWMTVWKSVIARNGADVQGAAPPGEGNISLPPRFTFVAGHDFLLSPDSPCVDAGKPEVEDVISDWHPRWPGWFPNGARSDMGAHGGERNAGWLR